MSKVKRRVFIIEIEIKSNCWDYKVGQIIRTAVISNNTSNACYSFRDKHEGSEYPFYTITGVYDTYDSGFFQPNIKSKNLL